MAPLAPQLSQQQRAALRMIVTRGVLTVGQLADALDTSKEGAAATAASLARHGYVQLDVWRGARIYRHTLQGVRRHHKEQG